MTNGKHPHVGGLVVGSTDPQRLHAWYRTAFSAPGTEASPEPMLALNLGGSYLIFEERDDVGPEAVEPGRLIVNYAVDDIRATEAHLNATLNVRWIRPVTGMDEGVSLATLEDPDGNYVQLIQSADEESAGAAA